MLINLGSSSLIKKDINTMLLSMIMVLIVAFTSITAYYNYKLDVITLEYNSNLQEITGKAVLQKQNETVVLKESTKHDKEMLEQGYSSLKFENENLKAEKAGMESELNSAISGLEEQRNKFNILETRFREVQDSLSKANDEISRLIAMNKGLCRKVKDYNPDDMC